MQHLDDGALLRQFAGNQSDEAFAGLVARYLNLVYSVAFRQVGDPHHAEEIAQAVFIILARKAGQQRHEKALSSWLFQTTLLTAKNFSRSEIRRQLREQEAYMESTLNEPAAEAWPQTAGLLDPAVGALSEKDRRVILLRFYEGRDLREVGLALGASEAAAEKRVSRALEKLRKYFSKRGVTLSTALHAGIVSANSVQAAPVGLAKTISVIAAAKGLTAGCSTLTLVKGALKLMAWTKAKTAIVAGVVVLLAAGTMTVVVVTKQAAPLSPIKSLPNPNGYDDLMRAGKMTVKNDLDYSRASLEQLRRVTTANARALDLARTGLSEECRVPLQYSETYSSSHIPDLAKIKRLTQAFFAEGKLAEAENRPNDAAKSYLDSVRLGEESTRGGVLIDSLVGRACEEIGTSNLRKLAGRLDSKSCHQAAEALESFDAQNETWEEIMQQEQDWSRRTFDGFLNEMVRMMRGKSMNAAFEKTKARYDTQLLKTRELMVELAARAYTLDKGQPPASLSDLVPEYLKAIPQNPLTGKDMVFPLK